ncbi:TPA: class I SAM-dependent methyltransferase [Salmonella enterica subsp. enterica serovar Muenchen]
MNNNSNDGAKVYTPFTLKFYDWWVLGISNRFVWKCPTNEYLLPHFLQHVSKKHLDVGVGTGYYLTHSPRDCVISLMDLNLSSLNAASLRVGKERIDSMVQHDAFVCYPESLHEKFDSVSMFYLLHCLPGNMSGKDSVIRNAAQALTSNGKLFGATILGSDVNHNSFGQKLMCIYNEKGIFSNRRDNPEGLNKILSEYFLNITIRIEGTVALFSAFGKRDHRQS